MSEALNVIKAHFGALREVTTAPVWQYNYGQKLEIDGIPNLPSTFEIHYSNSKSRGTAKRWIGYDGVVDVLDEYFRSGADIWGFIFLHEGEDDGETEYVIHIPVKERSEAEDSEPTPVQRDIVDEAIAALNTAVTQTAADVISADTSATAASQSATEAQTAAQSAQESAQTAEINKIASAAYGLKAEGYATGTQNEIEVGADSPYYQNNAKYYSEQSAQSASDAEQSEEASYEYAHRAELAAASIMPTDPTLSVMGRAADAKATGDAIKELQAGGYVADQQRIEEKIDVWLDEHPEATTTIQDGAVTWQKLNSTVQGEIAGKAPAIMDTTEQAYTHTGVGFADKIQFVGNEYAFDTARYANRRNYFPSIGNDSFTTKTLSIGRRGNFCTVSGSVESNGSVTTYAKANNDLTPGTYKLIFKVHPGQTNIGASTKRRWGITIDGTRYQDEIVVTQDASYEYNVTVANASPAISLYIYYQAGDSYNGFTVWYALYPSDVTIVDTEQTVSNGTTYTYEADIAEQIIDTCQHQSILEVSIDTKTYIDNYVPADVLTEQDLIYISPEMYGAKGDGTTDDTTAINTCLTAAYAGSVPIPVRGYGNYKTTGTININGNFGDIYIKRIKYSGNDFAVRIEGNRNTIRFGTVDAETAGKGIWVTNTTDNSVSNIIICAYLISKGVCIQLSPSTGYSHVSYAGSYYKLQYIRSLTSNCVYINGIYDDSTWEFGYLRNSSDYAIKIDTSVRMKVVSGDFEACYAGFYVYEAWVDIVGHIRVEEMLDKIRNGVADEGILAKLVGTSTITGLFDIDYVAIDASEHTTSASNSKQQPIYVGKVWRFYNYNYYGMDGGGRRRGNERFCADLYIVGDQKILVPLAFLYTSVIDDIDYGLYDLLPARYLKIDADNCTVTLSNSYCPVGVKELYIDQSEHTCTIVDMYGNTVFDGETLGAGKYKLIATSIHNSIVLNDITDWNPNNGINWVIVNA